MTPYTPACLRLAELRSGRIGAGELLEATLARIARVNPTLNAVVAVDADAARRDALESERRYGAGAPRALEGLPITIKDAYDTEGLVSTAGVPANRQRVPERDAAAVARLRAAGAVIVGKTNVPPYSGDFQTANAVYGRTANPYDIARSPGGSSGGAAAAVASGMASFELGSDLGGSIRWPAHACGLFGLKTTWGLASTRGHVPPPPGATYESELSVAGPLARSAADLDLVLGVIAGPVDPAGVPPRIAAPRHLAPKGLRVALWSHDPLVPTQRAVSEGVERAAAALSAEGAIVDDAARPDMPLAQVFENFALMNHALLAAGLPAHVRDRIAAMGDDLPQGDTSHRALQARGARVDVTTWRAIQDTRQALRRALADFFTRHDVILMPPAPTVAIPHDAGADLHARRLDIDGEPRPYFDFLVWSALASFGQTPAAVAPAGLTALGLPTGVQILCAEGADRSAIAIAGMIERLLGGFTAPPSLAND